MRGMEKLGASYIPLLLAIGTGALVAIQSVWNGIASRQIGALNTGLSSMIAGGTVALVLLAVSFSRQGVPDGLRPSAGFVIGAGILGVVILTGIAFSVQRVGVTAGLAGVIFGQLLLAFLLDLFGVGGPAVRLEIRRVIGLALLGVAVFLLLPRG